MIDGCDTLPVCNLVEIFHTNSFMQHQSCKDTVSCDALLTCKTLDHAGCHSNSILNSCMNSSENTRFEHKLYVSHDGDDVNAETHCSVRPVSAEISASSNFGDYTTCVNYATGSSACISRSDQTPAGQKSSFSDSSLSQNSDHSPFVHSTQVSDNTLIRMHVISANIVSNQSVSKHLLDLGLRCKGFRMGHTNIQGVSNKIDHVRVLLESGLKPNSCARPK